MGMFDRVVFTRSCGKCGEIISKDWQTKDGPCELLDLYPEELGVGARIYTSCDNCRTWNEYKKQRPWVRVKPDYDDEEDD